VKDSRGNSKGYSYVEFDEESAAGASLKLHQTQLDGRTLKVSISNPPAKKKRDLPDTLTAYVNNLPTTVTEDQVKKIFEGCNIKEIRLVKDRRTSKPKGFAYVDFADEASFTAGLKLNEFEVESRKIGVAKSNPIQRNVSTPMDEDFSSKNSKSSTKFETEDDDGFKKPKSRLMIMPRAMKLSNQSTTPKSNEEFRKLLNPKK